MTGSLFQKYFRRKLVDSEEYAVRLVVYIHFNPEHHGFTDNFKTYRWSSYQRILDDTDSFNSKNEVLSFFGGKDEYLYDHEQKNNRKEIESFVIED